MYPARRRTSSGPDRCNCDPLPGVVVRLLRTWALTSSDSGANSLGARAAPDSGMASTEKRIVYIIQSKADPARFYTGITHDVDARLDWHNRGPCGCTVHHRPWSLVVAMTFASEKAARQFERYLKSGSGRAFSKRHFAPIPETWVTHSGATAAVDQASTPLNLLHFLPKLFDPVEDDVDRRDRCFGRRRVLRHQKPAAVGGGVPAASGRCRIVGARRKRE